MSPPEYSPSRRELPDIRAGVDFVLLKVRAVPGAAKERVLGLRGTALKLSVHAPPERGKANQALVALLAQVLGIKASQLRVQHGEASRDKWVRIEGIGAEAIRERLLKFLGGRGGQGQSSA